MLCRKEDSRICVRKITGFMSSLAVPRVLLLSLLRMEYKNSMWGPKIQAMGVFNESRLITEVRWDLFYYSPSSFCCLMCIFLPTAYTDDYTANVWWHIEIEWTNCVSDWLPSFTYFGYLCSATLSPIVNSYGNSCHLDKRDRDKKKKV